MASTIAGRTCQLRRIVILTTAEFFCAVGFCCCSMHNKKRLHGIHPSSRSANPPTQLTGGRNRGATRLIKNNTKNTTNRILAMPAAVPAIPPKPSTAAINAITKNVIAQLNMLHLPFYVRSVASGKLPEGSSMDSLIVIAIAMPKILSLFHARSLAESIALYAA
jgi:hypothetical protein